jgi:CubicO group peptidase (beta-lactamase class C family)
MKFSAKTGAAAASLSMATIMIAACSSTEQTTSTGARSTTTSATTAATPTAALAATTNVATTTAATTTVAPTTTQAPVNDAAIAATRAMFADITDDDPGCSVAVARNGKVVFAEAYGAASLNPTVPMTTESLFDIGSTSKQFTATALQLLVDRSLADWDAPLSTYYPDFPQWAATVTLRQVATHQSGIPDYIGLLNSAGVANEDNVSVPQMLDSIAKVDKLDFAPGSSWAYSNSNYVLMGGIIEQLAKMSLAQFIETQLMTPANMAGQWDLGTPIEGKALSYSRPDATTPWTEVDWNWPQYGDGGVITNPSSVALWGSQYFSPTIGTTDINTQRFDGAAEVPAGQLAQTASRYGLGIAEENVEGLGRVLQHSGGWESYITGFAVAPERKTVVANTCTSIESAAVNNPNSTVELLAVWAA